MIDTEERVEPLLDVDVIPEDLQKRMIFYYPKNWQDLLDATEQAYQDLRSHVKEHGIRGWKGSLMIVENMGLVWTWAQDDYARSVYNMSLLEKTEGAMKDAVAESKSTLPTFDRMLDYKVINPKHDAWFDSLTNSGFNFVCTAWLKNITVSKGAGKEEVVKEKMEGKRNIGGKVDVVLKFHITGDKYLVDVEKGAGLMSRVVDREMDFAEFVRVYNVIQKADRKRRSELFKRLRSKRDAILEERRKASEKKESPEKPENGEAVKETKAGDVENITVEDQVEGEEASGEDDLLNLNLDLS
jgi:hypothetical protein